MNRHAYIAELTQLLYYMTPWDREATIAQYDKRLADAEDVDALVQEMGSPMKVAVTLNRSYEPSPKPDPNAPKPDSEPETSPTEEPPTAEEQAPETKDVQEVEKAPQEPIVEPKEETSAAEQLPEPEADADPAEEPVPEPMEVEAVEITTVPEAPQEPEPIPAPAVPPPPNPHVEGIFSEIFTAATEAQSALTMETAAKRRSPRPGILIPYVILCILLGVPVALILLAVNLLIFAIALTALAGGIYLLVFLFSNGLAGLGNHLVALGLVILGVTLSIALSALGIWFMQNAVTGFVGFLLRFGHEHGYREEGI